MHPRLNSLNIFLVATFILSGVRFPLFAAQNDDPQLKLHGNVQIQAGKELYDNNKSDNLDQLWGRANFGVSIQRENISGRINIRAFPGGFGYEVLTGATFDTTGEGAIKTKTTGIPNFQIENAWIQNSRGPLSLKVGRFDNTLSKTLYFGNYLIQNSGGAFMGKIAYYNALEFTAKYEKVTSSISFSAGDAKLNTGALRVYQKVSPLPNVNVGWGYFSNLFDKIYSSDAEITNRFVATGEYIVFENLMPYFEVGVLQNHLEKSWDVPLNLGMEIPTKNWVDFLALELEYTQETKREDNPLGLNLALTKNLSKYNRYQLGIATDTQANSFGKVSIALRYTGSM